MIIFIKIILYITLLFLIIESVISLLLRKKIKDTSIYKFLKIKNVLKKQFLNPIAYTYKNLTLKDLISYLMITILLEMEVIHKEYGRVKCYIIQFKDKYGIFMLQNNELCVNIKKKDIKRMVKGIYLTTTWFDTLFDLKANYIHLAHKHFNGNIKDILTPILKIN